MTWLAAELPPDVPVACVVRAAEAYRIPAVAVVAMLKQEGGQVGREYPRGPRTYYGPAQISDLWIPKFQELLPHAPWGAMHLRDNACINVTAGAYILAYYFVRENDWSRAFARYNVGSLQTPAQIEAGYRYARKVIGHWTRMHHRWGAV